MASLQSTTVNGSISYASNIVGFAAYDITAGTNATVKWTLKRTDGTTVATNQSSYVYRVKIVTMGTGTDTGTLFLAHNVDGAGWNVRTVYRDGTGSNHPYLFVDTDGLPKVTIDHPANYTLRVIVEEVNGGNSGATYGVFGSDAIISSNGNGTTSISGSTLLFNGATVATQSWVQSQGYLTSGSFLPLSGGTMTGDLRIDSGTHSLITLGNPIGSSYGGFIQTSDGKRRVFIGANLYDNPSTSWTVPSAGLGSAGISLIADTGGWGTSIDFIISNTGGYNSIAYLNSAGMTVNGSITSDGNIYISNNGGRLYFDRPNGATVGSVGWHTNDFFYVAGHPDYGPTAGNSVRVYGFGADLHLGNSNAGDVITINNSGTINTNYPIISNGTVTFRSTYSGGSGDWTNITNPTFKVAPASGYWRIVHTSNDASVSGVYNYQTGKDVYWGEPSDTGSYYFRGRILRHENSSGTISTYLHSNNYNSYSPTLTGGGASGTWSINITGGAGSANNSSQLEGLTINQIFNNRGRVHGDPQDFNSVSVFGPYFIQGTTNGPGTGSSQFYGLSLGLGNDYAYSQYAMQMAIPRYNSTDRYISYRTREATTWGGWNKIWAGYADTAGALSSMNISQFTNNSGYITSSGSISGSAGSVAWTNVTGRPSALSSFTNDIVARPTLNASGDFQFGGQDLAQNNFSLSSATTDTDQFGRYYYSGTSGSIWSRYLPVDKSGKYRMKIRWKASAGSTTYVAVILLDTNGNNINGAGTYWAYPFSGGAAPTSWTTNEYWYDGSSFPANAAYVAFGISHTNYGGGSATYYVSQLEIERYSDQISGNAIINAGGSYANPSWITSLAWSKITGAPAFITSYTETDTLASVTGRGASTSSVVTFNGNVLTSAGLSDTSYVRINNPGGGTYVTQASTVTGAIRIKLPTQGSAMMMTCTVKVYEYSTNRSFTITFGGHRDSNNWYNEFCYLDGGDARGELTVRFGVDGGKDCVYIGETNTSWSYPQVFVTDVQLGYSGYSATWLSGWEVAFVTGFSTVNRTQTAYRKLTPANYNSYAPTLTGGGASGTWSINVTGSSGSSGQVTHNASRTDGTWYNVGWFSGNPSPAYSSDSVRILSSQGALRANLYYDNEDIACYLDPNNASVLKYVEGSNDASFRGANRAINDWDYSGLTTNPTVNGYDDGSWFIDCGASNDWSRGLLSKRRFRRVENLTLEYEAYLEASTGGCIHYMIGFVGGDSTNYSYCQTPSNLNYHDCSNIAVYTNCSGSGSDYDFDSRNAWWRFKIVLKGSGARHYVYRGDEWRLIKDTTTNNQNDYEWVRVLVSGYRQRLYLRDVKVYVADAHRRGSEYISSIAGRLRVSTDVRTPIMYDSNNENYYCDPDLYSSLWGVAIRGDYSAGGAGNQLFLWGAGGTTTSGIGFKQVGGVWADHGATSGGYNTYFTMDTLNRGWVFRRATVGGSDWTGTNVASISNTGHAQFDGSVRSPIFYDSVNTNYYLDAASGSRLHRITLDQSRVDSSRYPVGHYTPNDTVFEIDPTWSEDQLQAYFNSSSVYWTNDSTAPGGYAIRIDGNVNVGGVYGSGFPYIPVDQDDVFYMECWIRSWDGSQGHYMGSIDFNSGFGSLGGNPGSFGYWVMSGTTTSSSWQKVSGYISGFGGSTGQFVNGTKYWTPQALFNYSNNSGTHRCVISGWKVIRVSQGGNRTFRNNVTINGSTTSSGSINCTGGDITSAGAVYASNWFRTYGNSGWYSQTYGGGMYMEDATWVRVYGSKQFYVANNSANAIAAAGDIVAYYSDERLKQKVGKVENALDKIRSLTAFYYTTNDLAKSFGYEKSEQQLGLSAQEVQKIAPEIVSLAPFDMKTLEDGSVVSKTGENYLTVKYDRLVPVLVEAIKEQQAQIEELKEQLKNK